MQGRPKSEKVRELERSFAALHGGGNGYAFASAPTALSALLDMLDSGMHVLVSDDARPDTHRMIEGIRRRSAGLKVTFADFSDPASVERQITGATRLFWVESVAGSRLRMADLETVAGLAKSRDVFLAVDNSILTHAAMKPIDLGGDIVFTSFPTSRGALVTFRGDFGMAEDRFAFLEAVYDVRPEDAQAASLMAELQRASQVLPARASAAERMSAFLQDHPRVLESFYPGQGCPDVSAVFEGAASEVGEMLRRLADFAPGSEPGEPGTYWHYAGRGHEAVPVEIREALDIPDGLVRFGMPDVDPDRLIGGFRAALS